MIPTPSAQKENQIHSLPTLIGGGIVLILSLILRVHFQDIYFSSIPTAEYPQNDARMYWEMSMDLYRKGWLLPNNEPFYQAPLYPYTLFLLQRMNWDFHDIKTIIKMQAFLSILSVMIVFILARKMLPAFPSTITALLYSFSHYTLFFETKILATTEGIFLFLLFAWLYLQWIQHPRKYWLAISAFVFSMAVLCRPNLIFTVPFLVFHITGSLRSLFTSPMIRKEAFIRVAIFVGVFLAGIASATLRNYLVSHDFVLISANAGVTLYMGTNEQAQGGLAPIPGLSNDIAQQKKGSIELAGRLAGKPLTPSQASRFWVQNTLQWVITHPLRWILLELKKGMWAFHYAPPSVNYSSHFEGHYMPLLHRLSWMTMILVWIGLCSIPVLYFQKNRIHSFFLCIVSGYIFLSLVYYASDRFLAIVLPFFAIMGMLAARQVYHGYLDRPGFFKTYRKRTTGFLVWCLGCGFLVLNPFLQWNRQQEIGMGMYNLGVYYEAVEKTNQAFQSYREAQKRIPNFPPLLLNLGVLYAKQGDLETSSRLFQRVLQIDPTHQQARKNLQINQQRLAP